MTSDGRRSAHASDLVIQGLGLNIRVSYMNPTIGPGFLNQVPTVGFTNILRLGFKAWIWIWMEEAGEILHHVCHKPRRSNV